MDAKNIAGVISIIIVLLVTIIISVLVYFSVAGVGELDQASESFTATNATNVTSTLTYTPLSDAEMTVTYYNTTGAAWHSVPTTNWTRTDRTMTFYALNATGVSNYDANLSQIRYQYYSQTGVIVRDNVNPQVQTVYTLAPIIAIVLIASTILLIVSAFGGTKPGI